ncbi:SRPBCC family protein [Microbacterium sp. 1P06AB]|uniref:SRPBCC family protein n=1 Tax=Microbacterium sp. 1P06AB TaxID=3132289 RepID=UPI0039A70B1A
MMYSSTLTIDAPPGSLAGILTDLGALAEWNPALGRVNETGQAQTGRRYRSRIRGVVPATIQYETASDAVITYRMQGPGVAERGVWTMDPLPDGRTRVRHEFAHTGLALRMMSAAFEPVAGWRLERLRDEVRSRLASRS